MPSEKKLCCLVAFSSFWKYNPGALILQQIVLRENLLCPPRRPVRSLDFDVDNYDGDYDGDGDDESSDNSRVMVMTLVFTMEW